MAPLDRAFALEHVHHVAVTVGKHLHLDVARPRYVLLHEHAVVAEGLGGLARRALDGRGKIFGALDDAHALAASAGRGFEQDGESDARRRIFPSHEVFKGKSRARHYRDACRLHGPLGHDLVAHLLDGVGWRPDEHESCVGAGAREAGVLGEEAVARMHRVDGVGAGDLQETLDVEVGLGRRAAVQRVCLIGRRHVGGACVGVGVDGDGGHAGLAHGLDDAQRDLAAVDDEDSLDDA